MSNLKAFVLKKKIKNQLKVIIYKFRKWDRSLKLMILIKINFHLNIASHLKLSEFIENAKSNQTILNNINFFNTFINVLKERNK